MACHKEFQTAGKEEGLQVWRIEQLDVKPVPKEQYGSFFNEDAYIVLYTSSALSHDIHMWLGEKCSQDEMGAAAIFACQLDDCLGGTPRQVRELQNYESLAFSSFFPSGIRYKKGGVRSGFTHVVSNAENVMRLLKVKGRRRIRAIEVELTWDNINKGDCFIIDLGKSIYVWQGSECSGMERVKATELAIDIRDNERKGRSEIHIVDETEGEPEAIIEVLGPKPANLPSSTVTDGSVDASNKGMASLYMVSDADGTMKRKLVSEKNPFKQDMLSEKECYILDNAGNNRIFVWKGKAANMSERSTAIKMADDFIKQMNYPRHTEVQIFGMWSEPTLFKQFFFNWQDKDETTGPTKPYTIGSIANVEQIPFDASKLHSNKMMAAQHSMVDDGSGNVKIWRVEGGDKVLVDPSKYGQFFGGDCYLVLYTYNDGGREKHIIYTWQGLKCSKDELGGSAILTVQLDTDMGGSAVQVMVTQGQEPPHLMSLFQKKPLIIHSGGTSREGGQSQPKSTRLFHIRESSTKGTRAVEVEPVGESLNTNDVFLLKKPSAQLVQWRGTGATEVELAAAKFVASLLGGTVTEVDEGKEPDDFWAALGGKKPYQTSVSLRKTVHQPRLFCCSNKTGVLRAEEVPPGFTQIDLATDDVMLLDTWDQIFLWIGKEANEVEKEGSQKIAKDYLASDTAGRAMIPINIIKQGEEPLSFTGWFQAWDSTMWDKSILERIKALI